MKFADWNKDGFNWNRMLDFCKKNIRYISSGVVVVILIIVLAVTAGGQRKETEGTQESKQENGAVEDKTEDQNSFETDAVPEINTLIQSYYGAYASGDIAALETYATPISDLEKGYIAMMGQYVTKYENIQCHTKPGLNENEYYVVVEVADTHYAGIETTMSTLSSFYVRQNESGGYYIDNLYSSFNWELQELEMDSQVRDFIIAYEQQEDVKQLIAAVQEKIDAVLEADAALKTMSEVTIPQAIQAWVAQVTGGTEGNAPEETTPPTEEPTGTEQTPEEPADTPDENQQGAATETVYATDNVNIRREPDETSEQVGSALAGASFTRTATTDSGWSEIDYNGGKAYIKSDYLSTEAPAQNEGDTGNTGNAGGGVNYLQPGETVTMGEGLNVRASMSEDAERLGTAEVGDTVTVVLSYAEGWTKVEWNGQTGYIRTDLLLNQR